MLKLLGTAALLTTLASCSHSVFPSNKTSPQKQITYIDAHADISNTAQDLLDSFSDEKLVNIQTDFASKDRQDWHFIPRERTGIPLRDMSLSQTEKAKALINATLSSDGSIKVDQIMALESILRDIEDADPAHRDPENYAFQVFGEPGEMPWGWRIEGHHLSLNFTFSGETAYSMTPAFIGSNPATYPTGPHEGKMLQDKEHKLALKFAQSLSNEQWAQTKLKDKSIPEVLSSPILPEDVIAQKEGIAVSQLSIAQQDDLRQIIKLYVGINRDALEKPYLELVEEGWNQTFVAWGGDRDDNATFYYRIQGPRIFIEFDTSIDDGMHIHSIWRDPQNDFGHDDLRAHLEKHH